MSNKMRFSAEDLAEIAKRKKQYDKEQKQGKLRKQQLDDDFFDSEDDDFETEEVDEYREFDEDYEEEDDEDDENNSEKTSSKIMTYGKWFIGIVVGIILITFIVIAINGRHPKEVKKEEPKQEQTQKQEDKKDDSKQDDSKKEKEDDKSNVNSETLKKATKSLEKPELLASEAATKTTVDDITKQVKAVFAKKGSFKSGSEKDVLIMTGRSSISSLNALIRFGYELGEIKVYESENKGIYQFTMKMTNKNEPNNDIVWTGNYIVDNKSVELVKYYGKLPNVDKSTNQVDEEKRTKD